MALTQAFTRQGFDLSRHPLSLLSLGDLGWIQIANFVVTGVLYVACAVGMRRGLGPGPGAAWGPRLVGVLGIGLIMGGVFLTDAGAGFPGRAGLGPRDQLARHAAQRRPRPGVGRDGRRLPGLRAPVRRPQAGKLGGSGVAAALAVVVLTFWPDLDGISVRLVVAQAIQFGFVAALAGHLMRGLPDTAARSVAARSR